MPKIVKGIKRPEVEIWKEIPGYGGYYEVSNWGRVRSWYKNTGVKNRKLKSKSPKILSPSRHGYFSIGLSKNGDKKYFDIHKLVAIRFVQNPQNKSQVNHKNGDIKINWSTNLEWVTPKENIAHAIGKGLINNRGENSESSKITKKLVKKIRNEYDDGCSQGQLSVKYKISQSHISRIVRKESWKHI